MDEGRGPVKKEEASGPFAFRESEEVSLSFLSPFEMRRKLWPLSSLPFLPSDLNPFPLPFSL